MNKVAGWSVYYTVTKKLFRKLTHEMVWGSQGISPLKRFKEGEMAFSAVCPNPKHQGARQSFIMPKAWSGGSCRMCGYRDNWLTTAAKKAGSFQDGVALLAQVAGVDLSEFELSQSDWQEMETTWKRLTVFGMLSHYFSRAFQHSSSPAAVAAKSYFKEMGMTERALISFPVGLYTTASDIRAHLEKMGIRKDFVEAAGVFSDELESQYPFVFGFGDAMGNITGFIGTEPGNPENRMPIPGFTEDLQNVSLFGLEQATPMIASERSAWLAASEVDTISIQHESNKTFKIFKQMLSLGIGLRPTREKLESLQELGAEHFIFVTPTTAEGRSLTNDFASIICELGVKADVLPLPEGVVDLRDLVKNRGYDYFDKAIVSRSGLYSIGRWLGKELSAKFDLTKEGSLAEARRAAAKASLELASIDAKEFVYEIGDKIKWDPHFWCIVLEQLEKTASGESAEALVHNVINQLETKRKDDLDMGFSWSISTEDLEEVSVMTVSEDELMRSFYNPRDVVDAYEASKVGLKTGLAKLDECLSLRPGEMTLVSGLPGAGKTTFCIHLISHFLRSYDQAVLFFSFEHSRIAIFNMLISNEFEIPHEQIVEKQLEAGGSNYQKYLNAVEEFTKYRDKLVVLEEPFHTRYTASDVQEICQMMSENVPIGLIVIDSLGMLAWDKTSPIETETQLGSAARDLLDAAKRVKAPLLVTNTPWIERVRSEGGDLAEVPLSVSLRVEPYATTILSLHHVPYSPIGEISASKFPIDRLVVMFQKNSMGKRPISPVALGFEPKYCRLVDITD